MKSLYWVRPGVRRLFRLTRRQGDVERDTALEIETHIALRAEQLMAMGYTAEAAREEAHRRFGESDNSRSAVNDAARSRETRMQFGEWMDALRHDVSFAARSLRREPLLATFIILTFALGIGANAAMFGVADRLLLSGPRHVRNPDQVVRLYARVQPSGMHAVTSGTFGYVTYDIMRRSASSFDGVAAYKIDELTAGRGRDAHPIDVGAATADLFPLLGVAPLKGRFFNATEDETRRAARVAVLSYNTWRRTFNGADDVLGKTLVIRDETYSVIGVAPDGFTGPELRNVDVWIPMSAYSDGSMDNWPASWEGQWLFVIGRMKSGVTSERVDADITAAFRRGYTGNEPYVATASLRALPLIYNEGGEEPGEVRIARWLMGVAVIVLIIACANVANLLLARAIRRRREVAVRVALGAGRGRVIRLLVTESVMLAFAGAVASVGVAYGTAVIIRTVLLPNIEWISPPIGGPVLVVSVCLAMLTGVIIGLIPALQISRPNLVTSLKTGSREGGGHAWRLRGMLTISQAALSVILLVGAGLFLTSLRRAQRVDLGIEPARVLVSTLQWPQLPDNTPAEMRLRERARRVAVYREALERTRSLPDVEHASLTIGLQFNMSYSQRVRIPGRDSLPRLKSGGPRISAVAPDYFQTVGTPILRGRAFDASDRAGSEPVAIVSALMASTFWPGDDAIGKCLYTGEGEPPCARIVGIAGDAHRSALTEDPGMHYYVPYGQERNMGGTALLVRPTGKPMKLAPAVTRIAQELDPTIVIVYNESLQTNIDPQLRPWRLGASILTLMGLLALVVAAIGLYSVMAYLVAQRAHELGVRVALGASATNIVALVLRGGVGLALVGVVLGLAAAIAMGQFAAPLLFETSPRDPTVFAGVGVAMILVATLASLAPAMRARRVSPLSALRAE